ncbi:predicted protein [Uncinocarpus reesii 1704]|uniref:Uncharacterized protein n=1 Tax=Uncinocarpus reesii (strain UAMH 1704) TaxID=336963 RepID=C4JMW3_UNCRE|nr:uncharacterized protein UREG_04171 [Uncinocarpus reesii 1704]EEP79325.1 predicted protein [Uncinocarpus reesii 1704]
MPIHLNERAVAVPFRCRLFGRSSGVSQPYPTVPHEPLPRSQPTRPSRMLSQPPGGGEKNFFSPSWSGGPVPASANTAFPLTPLTREPAFHVETTTGTQRRQARQPNRSISERSSPMTSFAEKYERTADRTTLIIPRMEPSENCPSRCMIKSPEYTLNATDSGILARHPPKLHC